MKKRIGLAILTGFFLMIITASIVQDAKRGVFAGSSFILEGHRGLSNRYPENTIVSFEAASKVSAFQGIETDVQETADGVLVLFHDSKLDKVTDATGSIRDYTFKEVQGIKIDNASNVELYPDEKIPVLEEYLKICRVSGKIPYIEMKQLSEAGIHKLIQTLNADGWEGKCVLTTFRKEYIPIVRKITNSYTLEYMVDKKEDYNIDEMIGFLLQYENLAFRPNAYQVTESDVIKCNKKGIRVESYGLEVGDKEGLLNLKKIGVEGVTCNDYADLE